MLGGGGGGAEGGDMIRLTRGMGLTGTCIPYNNRGYYVNTTSGMECIVLWGCTDPLIQVIHVNVMFKYLLNSIL